MNTYTTSDVRLKNRTKINITLFIIAIFLILFFIIKFFFGNNNSVNSTYPPASSNPTVTPKPTVVPTQFPKKAVALTFDDGPSPTVTKRILKTLKKHNAKATFFVLGNNASRYKSILKTQAKNGHELAIHSYDHSNYGELSNVQIKSQNTRTARIIKKVTGVSPTLTRTPYGIYSKRISKAIKTPIIHWNVDTLDWANKTSALKRKTIKTATTNIKHGDIILLHDIHPSTADVLDDILTKLEKKGFSFLTVSDLTLGISKKNNLLKNRVYFSCKSSKKLY